VTRARHPPHAPEKTSLTRITRTDRADRTKSVRHQLGLADRKGPADFPVTEPGTIETPDPDHLHSDSVVSV
jgi:hypothetical protein